MTYGHLRLLPSGWPHGAERLLEHVRTTPLQVEHGQRAGFMETVDLVSPFADNEAVLGLLKRRAPQAYL